MTNCGYPCLIRAFKGFAQVAQSVEQRTENPRVGSSILPLGTTNFQGLLSLCLTGLFYCPNICHPCHSHPAVKGNYRLTHCFFSYYLNPMQNAQIPIVGFAAASGTGKTTLLTQLIPLLKQRGFRIGLIKHSHHNFEIDHPGKDSYRLRAAGAEQVMLVSSHRRAIITEFQPIQPPSLAEQLAFFAQSSLDLILVEGFKAENFPKIELHRGILHHPLLYLDDDSIIAVATDVLLSLPDSVTRLDLNNPTLIAEFIVTRFINNG